MTDEEFEKYVIAEAKKYIYPVEDAKLPIAKTPVQESVKPSKPAITPSEIKRLAEEIKLINKKIDFRNPLISESETPLVEAILNKNESIRERTLDVDAINKAKNLKFQNESEKDKWNRMLNYDVPNDEER